MITSGEGHTGITKNQANKKRWSLPAVILAGSLGLGSIVGCESGVSGTAKVNGTPYTYSAGPAPAGSAQTGEETPPVTVEPNPTASGYTETAEWSAPEFNTLDVGAVKVGRTVVGQSYTVICRILPNPGQPVSVRNGGWYYLQDPRTTSGDVWVAANTFDNGQLPNNNPFDPSIATICPN